MFWPSFNAALAEGAGQYRVVINTLLSIMASCLTTFAVSKMFRDKFAMVCYQSPRLMARWICKMRPWQGALPLALRLTCLCMRTVRSLWAQLLAPSPRWVISTSPLHWSDWVCWCVIGLCFSYVIGYGRNPQPARNAWHVWGHRLNLRSPCCQRL